MRVGFSASLTGFIEVILMMFIGYFSAKLLHWDFYDALFLGAAISISSTTIIIKVLDELSLRKKHFSELICGVLIVEDLIAILILAGLGTLSTTHPHLSSTVIFSCIRLVIIVGGWFLIGYFILPACVNWISKVACRETLTITSIALCLSLATVAARFNYSVALGSFIMGSILAETQQIKLIERLIEPIRNIFGAVFFVSVGMLIDPKIILVNWKEVLLFAAIVIIGKILTTSIGALLTGQSLSTSIRMGFSMAQIGEFSFIIAGLGSLLHLTSLKLYPIVVAVSSITTFTTPYLIRSSSRVSRWLENTMSAHLRYLLDSYSSWFYDLSHEHYNQICYRRATLRCLANSIVVAILFISTANYILPFFDNIFGNGWLSDSLVWLGTIITSLPFLWGMIFAFRSDGGINYLVSTPLFIFPGLFAFAELSLLSLFLFDSWVIAFFLLFSASGFFFLFYRRLEISYRWFERRFIRNLNQRKKPENSHNHFHHALPWENHLLKLAIDYNSEAAYKNLIELQTREKYGINVIAIQREEEVIFAPRGDEKVYPLDLLLLLGKEEDLEAFRALTERREKKHHVTIDRLNHLSLSSHIISKNSSYLGKSIRESGIRENYRGIVIGLERHGKRYNNPDPSMILKEEDIILLLSSESL